MKNNKTDEVSFDDIPFVTIVTPSFNQGKFIRETIESVLNQDYPNIEYWVIDGGSTDETIDILKSYGDSINWVSEKDCGQADAVNKGISRAQGSIIGWLNSDDTYLEGSISHVVNFMNDHPEADMIYGEGYFIDTNSNIIDRYNTEKFNRKRLAETCMICQPTVFLTKEIVNKVGLLDENLDLCMDYELWMKIADIGKVMYTSKYLATSRMYAENKTLSRRKEVHKEICNTIYKHYGYVPFIWIYGYALQMNKGKRDIKLILMLLKYNIKFNLKHIVTILSEIEKLLKNKRRIKKNFRGRYDDGWLSEKYECKIKVDQPCNKIILTGNHIWPLKEKLEIKIKIDGFIIGDILLNELGNFRKEVLLEKHIGNGKHKVELIMSSMYCPNDYGIIIDKRKLTFKLCNIIVDA